MANKGKFKPLNPHKYKGDISKIIYRSSWELNVMMELDRQDDVLQWSSEEFVIPYKNPITGRRHRYFVDFWVKKADQSIQLVEVKPWHESHPPSTRNKKPRRLITEVHKWGINISKWSAAEKLCKQKGWDFIVMTEKGEATEWRNHLMEGF